MSSIHLHERINTLKYIRDEIGEGSYYGLDRFERTPQGKKIYSISKSGTFRVVSVGYIDRDVDWDDVKITDIGLKYYELHRAEA